MREVDGVEIYGIEDVEIEESSWCEHCGELEPYDATLNDGGTSWCMHCAEYNDEFIISKEEEKEIEIREVKAKIAHFEDRLNSLENKLSKLLGVE